MSAARKGNISGAESFFRRALKLDGQSPESLLGLARLMRRSGRIAEALNLASQAARTAPHDHDAHFFHGVCLMDAFEYEEAIAALDSALALHSDFVAAHDRRALALERSGRSSDALAAYRRAIEIDSSFLNAYANLGKLLTLLGRPAEASESFEAARRIVWDITPGLVALVRAHLAAGNASEALASAARARELATDAIEVQLLVGESANQAGDFTTAADAYRQAIRVDTSLVRPYYELAFAAKTGEADEELFNGLESLIAARKLDAESLAQAHFALGKHDEAMARFESAMGHYDQANNFWHLQGLVANPTPSLQELVDQVINTDKTGTDGGSGSAKELTRAPIFIVGTIRSGTTLLEQILASHSKVETAGELWYLTAKALPVWLANDSLDPAEATRLRTNYLAYLKSFAPSADFVIDKMPNNALLVGWIHANFPNATIIHCRRNALDTCLSIYTNAVDAEYAGSKQHIMHYYREWHRLMTHWRLVIPPTRFHEVDYEDLVENPITTIRRVADFVGLPWEPALLHHATRNAVINTPSRWQAKQPIYRSSVDRWRRFEPWLGEFSELVKQPSRPRRATLM